MLKILGGDHRGRRLNFPRTGVRPSMGQMREALFNVCPVAGLRFLDLFAGSGAVGLEALSRGAEEVVFVERDWRGVDVIKKNLHLLGEESRVCRLEVGVYLKQFEGEPFDVIFADPPYGRGYLEQILPLIDQKSLLRPGGVCFIEEGEGQAEQGYATLRFIKARRYGGSTLYQWRKDESIIPRVI